MTTVLFNPTNELFEGLYIGNVTVMEPGSIVKVDDARGRHLLNELGPRGLVSLEYGDEGEVKDRKGESGRQRNLEFKRKQVERYNQQNEARSHASLPYIEPTEQVKGYAKELGIGILQPYRIKDDHAEVTATLQEEITAKDQLLAKKDRDMAEMKKDMAGLQSQLNQLMAMLKAPAQPDSAAIPAENSVEQGQVDFVELRKSIGYLPQKRDHYEAWITNNWDKYETAPPEIQEDMQKKWIDFYPDRPFPKVRPIA